MKPSIISLCFVAVFASGLSSPTPTLAPSNRVKPCVTDNSLLGAFICKRKDEVSSCLSKVSVSGTDADVVQKEIQAVLHQLEKQCNNSTACNEKNLNKCYGFIQGRYIEGNYEYNCDQGAMEKADQCYLRLAPACRQTKLKNDMWNYSKKLIRTVCPNSLMYRK